MWRKRLCAPSSVSRRLAWLGAVAAVAGGSASPAVAQSPREANPERPTFATHAYAVAPGYAELEQGLAARGTGSLREETSWDVNLKVGVSHHLQIGLFGPAYTRTPAGSGVGDLGMAVKLRTDLSPRAAVALVPSVTAPTGSAARGLGAGRALGGLVGVVSADLPGVHVDVNAGPQGIGAGAPQWFASLGGYYPCTAEYTHPGDTSGTVFHNWTTADLGSMSLENAIRISCDTVFDAFGSQFYYHYVQNQLNDSGLHESMTRWAAARMRDGHNPFDGWYPYLGLGFLYGGGYYAVAVISQLAVLAAASRLFVGRTERLSRLLKGAMVVGLVALVLGRVA